MSQILKHRTRMDAVQAPIIAVVGEIIRQVPGTISLGQGVVHYGPPQAAIAAVRAALDQPSTHEYQDGSGLPSLVEQIERKLRTENGVDVARGSRVMVTAGANMAFMHAALARHAARRRDHPARAVLLQPRDGDSDGRLHDRARADRRPVPAAPRSDSPGDHRSHAGGRDDLAEQPERRGVQRVVVARAERALPRSRAVSHLRRDVRVLHLRVGAARVAGVVRRCRRTHDRDVLLVEGVRVRRLANRLPGLSRTRSRPRC